ncbi:hypothetical protein IM793_05440 [Pedobacter sp. MR2016-19]|uniref:hypothetical protein n=1 Tax=Pedobacter sp. MR2016-19 TaxID=2780089 RepID=UPI0018770990|nr:hypothetical protein [Pedobacter sp. MR2016-19]MBE5318589.1 hypothetical protein [Pedobacter sp. MR2016-19]
MQKGKIKNLELSNWLPGKMMYELISFREIILDAIKVGAAYQCASKELENEILKESKRIISSIQHNVTQIAPDRSKAYIRQHQRGLIQLMDELAAMVDEDNLNACQKNKNEGISSLVNLLNKMVLDLQQYLPYYFDYDCAVSITTQKQLLVNIAENSSKILKNLEELHADNETIIFFKYIFEHLNSGPSRFTFEQVIYLHDFFESLEIALNKFVPSLAMPGIILLLVSLNFNHPYFYHSCCSHFNQELQKCESISEQYRLIHFFKKLIVQVFKTISIPYNRNLSNIDESLLRYIESEISYLKSIDTIAEDLSGGGILDSNFKVTFTVRQLAIFIHLQVEAGIIKTQSPKSLHQYITKHYSTVEQDTISEKSFKNAYYGNIGKDVEKVIDKIVAMLAIAQEKC